MEKIEFYQRSSRSSQFIENILSTFFQILAMYVIKYFDLVVCFEKIIINFYQRFIEN